MKFDASAIQDLYHHSLAMINDPDTAFSTTLSGRLDSANRAREILTTYEMRDNVAARFKHAVPLPGSWGTEVQMVISGRLLLDAVNEYALLCGIDPRTGNRAA